MTISVMFVFGTYNGKHRIQANKLFAFRTRHKIRHPLEDSWEVFQLLQIHLNPTEPLNSRGRRLDETPHRNVLMALLQIGRRWEKLEKIFPPFLSKNCRCRILVAEADPVVQSVTAPESCQVKSFLNSKRKLNGVESNKIITIYFRVRWVSFVARATGCNILAETQSRLAEQSKPFPGYTPYRRG